MPTIQIIVKGKVQGVFFRASAKETADKTGVTGWVKNTAEGNVEAVITGEEAQIEQFINWCKKGPSKATVEDILVTEMEEISFTDFRIKR